MIKRFSVDLGSRAVFFPRITTQRCSLCDIVITCHHSVVCLGAQDCTMWQLMYDLYIILDSIPDSTSCGGFNIAKRKQRSRMLARAGTVGSLANAAIPEISHEVHSWGMCTWPVFKPTVLNSIMSRKCLKFKASFRKDGNGINIPRIHGFPWISHGFVHGFPYCWWLTFDFNGGWTRDTQGTQGTQASSGAFLQRRSTLPGGADLILITILGENFLQIDMDRHMVNNGQW